MDGSRDSHTKWSKSERERRIPCDITYIWSLIYGANEPFHWKVTHGPGEQACGCCGGGEGEGSGNLGLIDANYCLWNGLAMRYCCVALGTMSSHLWCSTIIQEKRMYTCMCDWVTMLYSRKPAEHCKPAIMEKIKITILKKKSIAGIPVVAHW